MDICGYMYMWIWGGPRMGVPQIGWSIRENPNLKWMIWGYPYFRKAPHV